MEMNRDWLARYRVGQREQVWHELRQLGAAVREPEIRAEAQLVCDEMAVRARHNIEVIVERLTQDGFRFHTNDDEQTPVTPHIPPTPTASDARGSVREDRRAASSRPRTLCARRS